MQYFYVVFTDMEGGIGNFCTCSIHGFNLVDATEYATSLANIPSIITSWYEISEDEFKNMELFFKRNRGEHIKVIK